MSNSLKVRCQKCENNNSKRFSYEEKMKEFKCNSCGFVIPKKLLEEVRFSKIKKRFIGVLKQDSKEYLHEIKKGIIP